MNGWKGPHQYFIHSLQWVKGFIEYCIFLQGYMLVSILSWFSPPFPHGRIAVKYIFSGKIFSLTLNKIFAFVLFSCPNFSNVRPLCCEYQMWVAESYWIKGKYSWPAIVRVPSSQLFLLPIWDLFFFALLFMSRSAHLIVLKTVPFCKPSKCLQDRKLQVD